jgi:hypothetical protein
VELAPPKGRKAKIVMDRNLPSEHLGDMNKKGSDWRLPEEVLGFLGSIFFLPVIAAIAVLSAMLLPSITSLQRMDITRLFWVGFAAGISGVILLFFARLPLYRQRRFWTFGPRELDRFHRRLYWSAYLVVLASIGLLVIVWLRVRWRPRSFLFGARGIRPSEIIKNGALGTARPTFSAFNDGCAGGGA